MFCIVRRRDGVSKGSDQGLGPVESVRRQAVADPGTVDGTAYQPGLLEELQMLGDRRLCQRKLVDNLTTEALTPPSKEAEDLHPSRMPESLCKPREFFIGFITHDRAQVQALRFGWADAGFYEKIIGHRRWTITVHNRYRNVGFRGHQARIHDRSLERFGWAAD